MTTTGDGLEIFLPVLYTVTVLGGWWRWGHHHFLTVLELLNFSQQLFLIICQGPILFPGGSRGWARDVIAPLGIPLRIPGRQRRFSLLIGFLGRVVMKPTPVLGTQGLIGPPEEATRFLGTIQKQTIGVLGRMALLQRGGFPAKALQTSPHVQHFCMRLTIHGFHILQSLILTTKQQTGLHGTFHILPSLLRFSGLQTHVMARAYHIVHLFLVVFDWIIDWPTSLSNTVIRVNCGVDCSAMSFNSFIISSTAARVSSTTSPTTGSQSTGVIV